jgi:hypothetical protein
MSICLTKKARDADELRCVYKASVPLLFFPFNNTVVSFSFLACSKQATTRTWIDYCLTKLSQNKNKTSPKKS